MILTELLFGFLMTKFCKKISKQSQKIATGALIK